MERPANRKPGKVKLSEQERKARQEALKNEPKDAKFKRLASRRVPKALKAISVIGNLANRQLYQYSDAQRVAICTALQTAVEMVLEKFAVVEVQNGQFALPE